MKRWRRRAKWVGIGVCLLLAAVYVAGVRYHVEYRSRIGFRVEVGLGAVEEGFLAADQKG